MDEVELSITAGKLGSNVWRENSLKHEQILLEKIETAVARVFKPKAGSENCKNVKSNNEEINEDQDNIPKEGNQKENKVN